MPLGPYKDFAACVAANQDKDDPKAFCGALEARVKKAQAQQDERLVFGWAYVASVDGQQVTDWSGDQFPPRVVEKAAYEFMEASRQAGEMHEGDSQGMVVESFAATQEKWEAMGIDPELAKRLPQGIWVGARLDATAYQRVKDGSRRMFSIQGEAIRA